jgi:histidine ammonia-lyase
MLAPTALADSSSNHGFSYLVPLFASLATLMTYNISGHHVQIEEIIKVCYSLQQLSLSDDSRATIISNRAYLESRLQSSDALIYGIKTGFGSLCDVRISADQLVELQRNLVLSHACGMGAEIPTHIARLIFLLKILNLAHGRSGVRIALVDHMIAVYNADIMPIIYEQGSLGASGDLAPLAHLSLCLIGEGSVRYRGQIVSAATALSSAGIVPIRLAEKEGIALLNGTQFSLAYAVHMCHEMSRLASLCTHIAAMSSTAFHCDIAPYHHLLHDIRPHAGQLSVAATMYDLLSERSTSATKSVQDPYSFRCIPQVHGASLDALQYVTGVVTTELNSVTDNPMIFHEEGEILSGGNFHAQPLALALDFMAIAMAELGSISERRIYLLINGDRGLPPFLTRYAGLHSGLMIAQYTAASIVSQSKQLCTPASVDSIISSKGQEDHVSMAANAATKAYKVIDNLKSIVAIEWLAAAQAIDLRGEPIQRATLRDMYSEIRSVVPVIEGDRLLHDDMVATRSLIDNRLSV